MGAPAPPLSGQQTQPARARIAWSWLLPAPRARDRNATITPGSRICPAQLRIAICGRLTRITARPHSARLRQLRPTGGSGMNDTMTLSQRADALEQKMSDE